MEPRNLTLILALLTVCLGVHLSSAGDGSRDDSYSTRQGRLLDGKKARKLGMLKFLGGIFLNSAGKGSFAASNTYSLFGKTINSALSLSYGNTGAVPILPGLPTGGSAPVVAGVGPGAAAAGPPALAVRTPQEDTVVISSTNGLLPASAQPQELQDTNDLKKPMASNDGIRDQKFSGGPLPEEDGQTTQPSLRQNIVVDFDGALKLLESEQFNRFIAQHNANVEVLNNKRNVVG